MKFQTPPNPKPRRKHELAYTDHHSFCFHLSEPRLIYVQVLGQQRAFAFTTVSPVSVSRHELGLYCEPGPKEVDPVLKAKVAYLNARAVADPADVQVGDLVVLNRSESYDDSEVYTVTALDANRADLVVVLTDRRGWSPADSSDTSAATARPPRRSWSGSA